MYEVSVPLVEAADSNLSESDDSSVNTDTSICSGEEIWEKEFSSSGEESEEEDDDHKKARNMLFGISHFLNFFLLTFRISERAMLTFLLFIQHLICYIYSIIGMQHRVIDILLSIFPKSLYCLRKLTNTKQDLLEYVVCPKCNCLYLRTDCIINF